MRRQGRFALGSIWDILALPLLLYSSAAVPGVVSFASYLAMRRTSGSVARFSCRCTTVRVRSPTSTSSIAYLGSQKAARFPPLRHACQSTFRLPTPPLFFHLPDVLISPMWATGFHPRPRQTLSVHRRRTGPQIGRHLDWYIGLGIRTLRSSDTLVGRLLVELHTGFPEEVPGEASTAPAGSWCRFCNVGMPGNGSPQEKIFFSYFHIFSDTVRVIFLHVFTFKMCLVYHLLRYLSNLRDTIPAPSANITPNKPPFLITFLCGRFLRTHRTGS